ncbi:MAG TPA: type VI secretion system contractile sheath large subunit, partial [Sphingobacteriaceae bacterium]
ALFLLVRRVETDSNLKIFILDAAHQELTANLKSANNLTDSFFYRHLQTGSYSIIAGNYSFGLNVDDIAALMRLGKLAYDFNAAFISHLRPEIFGVNTFLNIRDVSNLEVSENSMEFKLWQALRTIPESSHIGLCPMRVLGRMPYGDLTDSIETFSFEEFNSDINFEEFLWLNPCFIIVSLLAQSYKIAGSQMGKNLLYDIENLPLYIYREDGATKTLPCAEIVLTENLLEKMLAHGFVTLISFRDSNRLRIARYQSVSSTPTQLTDSWNL